MLPLLTKRNTIACYDLCISSSPVQWSDGRWWWCWEPRPPVSVARMSSLIFSPAGSSTAAVHQCNSTAVQNLQLFFAFNPPPVVCFPYLPDDIQRLVKLNARLKHTNVCMTSNFLLLNSDKTEVIALSPKNLRNMVSNQSRWHYLDLQEHSN